ncbi:ty3-gypsy retrotransposon protein [Tanacetum coccineum]
MEEEETRSEAAALEHVELTQLLERFNSLLHVPTTLPPHHSIDHRIHLLPDTKPLNVRPYRYPHYQIGEMKKLVKEMLDQGIICFSQSPFSRPCSPLTDLLRKDGIKWGVQEAYAFEELKQQLSTSPILSLSDFNQVFVVEVDASANGIGVVADALSRMYEDEETVRAAFMALSQLIVGFMADLKGENETLEELLNIHQQLDMGAGPIGFRREQGLVIFQDRYYVGKESKLKRLLLQEFHDTPSAEHRGVKKMLVGLSALFYWPGMRKSVKGYIKQCLVCQQTKTAYHPQTDGQTEVVNWGLEQYLRAMVSDRPQQWVRFLPWAEFYYNTSYHSNIKMSLYQALYGRLPLSLLPYPLGSSKVATVEELLVERDELMRRLKQNLLDAKNRMEIKANRNRRDVEFNVGDKVLVKLQLYRQITISKRISYKLAKRFYVPYETVERIRKVAYQLALTSTSAIHPVFHVSILKLFTGRSPEEWLSDFQSAYPTYDLEDKVIVEEGENVTPMDSRLGRGK